MTASVAVPVIIPRGLDDLLSERRDAARMRDAALRCGGFEQGDLLDRYVQRLSGHINGKDKE